MERTCAVAEKRAIPHLAVICEQPLSSIAGKNTEIMARASGCAATHPCSAKIASHPVVAEICANCCTVVHCRPLYSTAILERAVYKPVLSGVFFVCIHSATRTRLALRRMQRGGAILHGKALHHRTHGVYAKADATDRSRSHPVPSFRIVMPNDKSLVTPGHGNQRYLFRYPNTVGQDSFTTIFNP